MAKEKIEKTEKKRVILVTDGDKIARQAVEKAAKVNGCRCISASAGNPTPLTGEQVVAYINATPSDPVVVMVDDRGVLGKGKGEKVMEYLIKHPTIKVIGVVAVASNTENAHGASVDSVITKGQEVTKGQVDKEGNLISNEEIIRGDTVDNLNQYRRLIPYVIGVGDIGKMDNSDKIEDGAKITTKAIKQIIENWQRREN